MRTHLLIVGLIFGALAHSATAANHDSKKFLKEAAQDGIAEVSTCKLALKKTKNPEVKRFAERMITDHTRMNNEITRLAKRKGIELPTGPGVKGDTMYAALSATWGGVFDREFMSHNVSDHETDVKDFREQSENGTDPEVKALAAKGLKTLEGHLRIAKSVQEKVKGEKKK